MSVDEMVKRCDQEISIAQEQLRAGDPDIEGLLLAIADWAGEKRMLLINSK